MNMFFTNYDNTDNHVKLMTVHASKGLEFDVVFLIGLDEGIFPHSKNNDDDKLEEERRLMYVAITRARARLYLSSVRSRYIFGKNIFPSVSRFVHEIPKELISDQSVYINNNKSNTNSVFNIGDRVKHNKFGNGKIISLHGNFIEIIFVGAGKKEFDANIVQLTKV